MSARSVKAVTLRADRLEDRTVPAGAGALDPTFGGTGIVTADVGAGPVAVTPDGKVVTLHSESLTVSALVSRLLPNGQPDTSFDGTGRLDLTDSGGPFSGGWLAVLPDGSMLVVGQTVTGGAAPARFVVARVSADGSTVTTTDVPAAAPY